MAAIDEGEIFQAAILTDGRGDLVGKVTIPAYTTPPLVLLLGARTFIRNPKAPELTYKAVFAHRVPYEDPQARSAG